MSDVFTYEMKAKEVCQESEPHPAKQWADLYLETLNELRAEKLKSKDLQKIASLSLYYIEGGNVIAADKLHDTIQDFEDKWNLELDSNEHD